MNRAGRGPRILFVSGHDPSGGAGIDADRSAVRELDVVVSDVITAFTDQDDRAVRDLGAREASVWLEEAERAMRVGVDAVKFGLLPGVEHVRAAASLVSKLREPSLRAANALSSRALGEVPSREPREAPDREPHEPPSGAPLELPIVVDPVLRSTSGAVFLNEQAIEALRNELCRGGVILTPNLHEAAALARMPLEALTDSLAARAEAAHVLLATGLYAVVIKGGHGNEDPVRDLVAEQDAPLAWLEHPRVVGGGIRGSGCRFAAHFCARLAMRSSLVESARAAGLFVAAEIASAGATAR